VDLGSFSLRIKGAHCTTHGRYQADICSLRKNSVSARRFETCVKQAAELSPLYLDKYNMHMTQTFARKEALKKLACHSRE